MTPEAVANSLVTVVVIAFLAVWSAILHRRIRGEPLVPFQPRKPVAWAASDVAVVLAIIVGPIVLSAVTSQFTAAKGSGEVQELSSEEITTSLLASSAVYVLLFALAIAWLRRPRFGRIVRGDDGNRTAETGWSAAYPWGDLGFATHSLTNDVWLGLAAFAAVSVPIYALQSVLSWWIPGEHEIMRILEAHPNSGLFLACAIRAVLVAPISEEFLFRGMLQGWLESSERRGMRDRQSRMPADVADAVHDGNDTDDKDRNDTDDKDRTEPSPDDSEMGRDRSNPEVAPQTTASDLAAAPGDPTNPGIFGLPAGVAPVLISSTLFALAHLGDGPAPIPLFFLALVLGYLYRQTHRLWPSVVVHMSLNACTMAAGWIDLSLDK